MAPERCLRLVSGLAVILLLAGWVPHLQVKAQSSTAMEIINHVNGLRASRGLPPYHIDAGIMAYAQEHSEYLASIHHGTHIHQDGKLPQDHGLQENVAGGDIGLITPENAVYEIWQDAGHLRTMINSSGWVGVGVARDS